MKKINLNSRRMAIILCCIFVVATIGFTIYELFELQGLRARVHTLEYQRGVDQAEIEEQNKALESEKIDYKEVSKVNESVRIQAGADYYNQEGYPIPATYDTKEVVVYKVKITNNTSYAYDFTEEQIRGKTKSGSLVDPVYRDLIHPDDLKGKDDTLALAPGGSAETYVYFLKSDQVQELFFNQL